MKKVKSKYLFFIFGGLSAAILLKNLWDLLSLNTGDLEDVALLGFAIFFATGVFVFAIKYFFLPSPKPSSRRNSTRMRCGQLNSGCYSKQDCSRHRCRDITIHKAYVALALNWIGNLRCHEWVSVADSVSGNKLGQFLPRFGF